jgi:hypothetical protein
VLIEICNGKINIKRKNMGADTSTLITAKKPLINYHIEEWAYKRENVIDAFPRNS